MSTNSCCQRQCLWLLAAVLVGRPSRNNTPMHESSDMHNIRTLSVEFGPPLHMSGKEAGTVYSGRKLHIKENLQSSASASCLCKSQPC